MGPAVVVQGRLQDGSEPLTARRSPVTGPGIAVAGTGATQRAAAKVFDFKEKMVGAAGIEPATLTMSTKSDAKQADQTGDETSPAALTRLTRDLFEHIMFLYKVPPASETAQWLEDRLDFFRRLQFEMDPGTAEILTELIGLFEAGRYDLLIAAIERYHDRHIACLDQVLERGFGRSYSTQKGQRYAQRMGPQGLDHHSS